MENQYTAIIKKDGDWWIGWIEEIKEVNAQESTQEELIESRKDILELNREEARTEAIENYEEVMITL